MQTRSPRFDSKPNNVSREAGLIEIYKLQQNILAITERNKSKYLQILSHDPNYNLLFYQPNDKLKTEKAFKKQLLLKQLDKLMDQETIFDKKLAQLNFINEIQTQQQTKTLDKELNPYQALRTVWAKHQKNVIQAKNSSDRLESLNWTIGMIKNTVSSMKQKEQQSVSLHRSQAQTIHNQNYQKLLLDYNQSLRVNQQLQQEILSLKDKVKAKQQSQSELQQRLEVKQKQIKCLKKSKQLADVDHRSLVAKIEQEHLLLSKKLLKLEKWKANLEKTSIEHKQQHFKLYFDILNQNNLIDDKIFLKNASKNLNQIVGYITQQNSPESLNVSTLGSSNPSEVLNSSSFEQQNNEIMIPTLNLTEPNYESPDRKKVLTDRPLKSKNFELQKFVGNKLVSLKFSKMSQTVNLNDETTKKFVRKNPVLGNSRRLETQYSERYCEIISNSNT